MTTKQPTEEELDAIRDEIAWGRIEGDTYILPAIAEYVLKLQAEVERLRGLVECSGDHTDLIADWRQS